MRTQEHITTTTEIVSCDFCGQKWSFQSGRSVKRCSLCGKDVCLTCANRTDWICDLRFNNNFDCDRPEYVCKSCWDIGKSIRTQIMESREFQEKEEESLMQLWKNMVRVHHEEIK